MQEGLRVHAGPDHWNDPDMMEVGNGMKVNEDRAHFFMWCMLAAPLIAGNDLRKMSKETVEILTNREAIGVNQDSLGIQGLKYSTMDSLEIWFKPLAKSEWAVCFLNRGAGAKDLTFSWQEHKILDTHSKREFDCTQSAYTIRDLWVKKDLGKTNKAFVTRVASHDAKLLKLRPVQ